ncbi:MAG: outer membrane beta-barrel protein, partial [Bacteroidota bacterium]
QFTRSDKLGAFVFTNLNPGTYIMLVTYPKFTDLADEIVVKENENDLGIIALTEKTKLLEAVVIKSAGAVRIKGDTTEFVADSFKVRDGATVEELLKKLPGFQVNSKGEITAQGQRVQKVLVDGEEFFGDDPTMATKNLGAKAVDKVQVFDNKSEQQNLTGISTGAEGKTVNIKLKEESKKGSFGKAEAGTNFDNIVDARLLYNNFKGKKKFSVYGTKSNTSTGSLNWEDRRKLGMENDFEYDELSGYYFSFGSSDEFEDWSLRGLPNAYTAGMLYINKWNEDKQNVSGSYRFNRLLTNNITNRLTQSIIPNNFFSTTSRSVSYGLNQQHAGNGKYEWRLDSLTSFKLITALTRKTTEGLNNSFEEISNPQNDRRTVSERNNSNYATKLQADNQLQYKQLFTKKNRQLLTTLRYGYIEDKQDGLLYSDIDFYKGGVIDSSALLDQQKLFNGSSTTLGGKITFSEPFGTKWRMITEYSYNQNNSISKKNTFEKSSTGKYEIFNPVFSNNFDLGATSHGGTLFARYDYKKIRAAFGSGFSSIKLNLQNLDLNTTSVYRFRNIIPQASFNYALKPQTGIGLNYRGNTRQPTINQLQPLRDNNDPLNIYIGNPDLKVGFTHNISLRYNSYKVLKARGIWAQAGIDITENAISQKSTFDANTGRRTYTPVNVDGNYRWFFYGDWNKGQGEKKLNNYVRLQANGGRNAAFVNGLLNENNYYDFELSYGMRYEVADKIRFNLAPMGGYNFSKSSLNESLKNNYFSYGGEAELYLMLPGKIEINTTAEFNLRQRIDIFDTNPNIIFWKADVSKKVFKNKSGKFILLANDILDRNKGFQRNISSERVTEETYQRLSRYVMLKFEWSFNKMPGGVKQ